LNSPLGEGDVLIRNIINKGFSTGNNQGAIKASGEFICFLNNDCE
ncbi:unnamed protein product, partial [marine sediment metagenome]